MCWFLCWGGAITYFYWLWLLLLYWLLDVRREHDSKKTSFHSHRLIDLGNIGKGINEALEQFFAEFLVQDLAPLEHHGSLDLMSLFKKLTSVTCLEVKIVRVSSRFESNFLERRMRLRLLLLLFPLGLFVNELTIVDDLAYRRIRLWCNLYKVEFALKCNTKSFAPRKHAKRTTLGINNT